MTAVRRRRDDGFTLLELIVAAGILALIAVFSWRGLDALIRERDAIAASQVTIDALQRAFARIERDALLAGDAQLDEGGALRLVAGAAAATAGASAGASAATVEYRVVDGSLTRGVGGAGSTGTVVLDDVGALAIEAWLPAPGGGAWVRVKAAATEAPRPPSDAAVAPGGTQQGNDRNAGVPLRTSASNAAGSRSASAPLAPAGPVVVAATGIRLSLQRGDGTRVVRAFMVGGA